VLQQFLYPRDAALWLCVCVCQVRVLSKRLNESNWFLARELPSTISYYVKRKLGCLQKSRYFPLELCPKLRHMLRHISRRNVLSTQLEKDGRFKRDKLDRRRPTKLTMPPSSDARPLQFITGDRKALSTARFRCAGQLATADTSPKILRRRLR